MNGPQKIAKDRKENKQLKFLTSCSLCSFAAKILPRKQNLSLLQRRDEVIIGAEYSTRPMAGQDLSQSEVSCWL
jgi:hypothetical protein